LWPKKENPGLKPIEFELFSWAKAPRSDPKNKRNDFFSKRYKAVPICKAQQAAAKLVREWDVKLMGRFLSGCK
jgi:hypothetical protein